MGLFSGLLGNASQKDIEKTERQLEVTGFTRSWGSGG